MSFHPHSVGGGRAEVELMCLSPNESLRALCGIYQHPWMEVWSPLHGMCWRDLYCLYYSSQMVSCRYVIWTFQHLLWLYQKCMCSLQNQNICVAGDKDSITHLFKGSVNLCRSETILPPTYTRANLSFGTPAIRVLHWNWTNSALFSNDARTSGHLFSCGTLRRTCLDIFVHFTLVSILM